MEKTLTPILVLLIIVVVAWVGLSLYFNQAAVVINPNAATYIATLRDTFDKESFDLLIKKTGESLPIQPELFLNIQKN